MELSWAAGKYIYPKGTKKLAHFMPLQDFSLEIAQNFSLYVSLRLANLEKNFSLLEKLEIRQWRTRLLTQEFVKMVKACNFLNPIFHDCGCEMGLIFEELKIIGFKNNDFQYNMYFNNQKAQAESNIFKLNKRNKINCFSNSLKESDLSSKSVVFFNSHLGVRPQFCFPEINNLKNLEETQGIVVALKFVKGKKNIVKTSVYGEEIEIPSFYKILDLMSLCKRSWFYKILDKYDKDFFLPDNEKLEVNTILAYSSVKGEKLKDFKILDPD
tara:strand:+ start:457 stop:1266 length:810 start_codon:yes stop_codon:yes gene_type:complete